MLEKERKELEVKYGDTIKRLQDDVTTNLNTIAKLKEQHQKELAEMSTNKDKMSHEIN